MSTTSRQKLRLDLICAGKRHVQHLYFTHFSIGGSHRVMAHSHTCVTRPFSFMLLVLSTSVTLVTCSVPSHVCMRDASVNQSCCQLAACLSPSRQWHQ